MELTTRFIRPGLSLPLGDPSIAHGRNSFSGTLAERRFHRYFAVILGMSAKRGPSFSISGSNTPRDSDATMVAGNLEVRLSWFTSQDSVYSHSSIPAAYSQPSHMYSSHLLHPWIFWFSLYACRAPRVPIDQAPSLHHILPHLLRTVLR